MNKLKTLFTIICLTLTVTLLCCCSAEQKLEKAINKMTKNLSNAKTVTQSITVKDGDTLVYQLVKTVEFNGNEANVKVEKSELANDFTLQTTVTNETTDKSSQTKLPINLSNSVIQFSVLTSDKLSCVVAQDKASELLGADSYTAAGDISIECSLQKGSLLQMNCSYATSAHRNVVIAVECVY